MLEDLDSGAEIARSVERLLRSADAYDRLPTPVEDIVAAAELQEAEESWLSESALAGVPDYLAKKIDRLKGRVHAALDRKTREIHISPEIEHDGQRRFKRSTRLAITFSIGRTRLATPTTTTPCPGART